MFLIIAPVTIIVPIATEVTAERLTLSGIIYLVILLVVQALSIAAGERSKLRPLGRYLSVGTIPLFFVFLLAMILKGLEAFS